MSAVSRILGHNLRTCQYCFMFVKNVDGVPSALASFARRPQSTIYLKTINCGGQNLINKCHRWKEWKYVNSRLAFTQPFDVYTTTIEVPILNPIGVLILLIVAEEGKLFWLRFPCLSNSGKIDIGHDWGWQVARGDCNLSPTSWHILASHWSKWEILSSHWLNSKAFEDLYNRETWVQMLLRAFCPPHLGCQSEGDFCVRHASLNSFQPCSN